MSTIQQETNEPDATHFRVGDWWISPKGTRFLIVERSVVSVCMRAGGTGRKRWRGWDDIGAHGLCCWVRESWGGAA